MSKKFFIIITIILAIFVLALTGYYFIIQSNTPGSKVTTTSVFKNFFPFGGNTASVPTTGTTQTNTLTNEPPVSTLVDVKLRKLYADPIAGFGDTETASGTVVRFMDTATGHVFETDLFSPRQERITNTTIPVVYNAYWGNDINSFITMYLKDNDRTVSTYSVYLSRASTTRGSEGGIKLLTNTQVPSINLSSNPYVISAIPLAQEVASISVLNSNMFYVVQSQYGSTGFISNLHGGKQKQVWNSPITEIIPQFVNDTTIAITTKPYQNVSGFLYFINTITGGVKRVLGDIPGLSTLVSPDAKKVLNFASGGGVALSVMHTDTQVQDTVTPTTFPEKCVWSKKDTTVVYCAVPHQILGEESLTDWYKGKKQFSDDVWKYDLTTNTSHVIENISTDTTDEIDVIKPVLTPNEKYLLFVNKKDGALWSLDLTK